MTAEIILKDNKIVVKSTNPKKIVFLEELLESWENLSIFLIFVPSSSGSYFLIYILPFTFYYFRITPCTTFVKYYLWKTKNYLNFLKIIVLLN